MDKLIGVAVIFASAMLVYFLHTALDAEAIAIILLLLSISFVVVDYQRRYYYLLGLVLYPLITTINVAILRDQSLYPIVMFYELSMVAMILFGIFLGIKLKQWIETRSSRQ
jgi:hypothetical protein